MTERTTEREGARACRDAARGGGAGIGRPRTNADGERERGEVAP